MVVDEECAELGIDRTPTGVASLGDDRRPPLFWVDPDIDDCQIVLMYERRHLSEEDSEQLPTSILNINELLVDAHEVYANICDH